MVAMKLKCAVTGAGGYVGSRIAKYMRSHGWDVLELTRPAALHIAQTTAVDFRAADFAQHNIKGYDALHIAAAELARADYLLTTDQRLLTRANRAGSAIQVTLLNPINWPPQSPAP